MISLILIPTVSTGPSATALWLVVVCRSALDSFWLGATTWRIYIRNTVVPEVCDRANGVPGYHCLLLARAEEGTAP